MASHVYAQFFRSALHKELNVEADALKLLLTTSAYVPSQANDRYQSSITNEVSGAGYVAGGVIVSGVTATDSGGVYTLNASTVDYGIITVTGARIAVLYDSTPGSAATNPLIWYQDFGVDNSPNGIDFQVLWNASGIFTVTPT